MALSVEHNGFTYASRETNHSLKWTALKWIGDQGGAVDFFGVMSKASTLVGELWGNVEYDWTKLASRSKGFVAAAAVLRLPKCLDELMVSYNEIREARKIGKQIPLRFWSIITHNHFDLGTMMAFSIAFFKTECSQALDFGTVLKTGSDATDVVTNALRLKDACTYLQTPDLSEEVIHAFSSERVNAALRLAKSITGFVTDIFAVYALTMGKELVSRTIVIAIELFSKFCSISAFYQSECFSDRSLSARLSVQL